MKKIILIAMLCCLAPDLQLRAQNTWTQKANFGGTGRYNAAGFSVGNKGYIGTGNDAGYQNDLWEFDPVLNAWTQKANFGGTGRRAATGFSIGNKSYLGTGTSGSSQMLNDFWEYDPALNAWTQKANFGGTARIDAVGFSIGNKGYIGTGEQTASPFYKMDFWEYDPSTNLWTQKANFGGTARRYATGFSIGSKGYLGTGYGSSGYKNDFWEYDPALNTWTQKANFGGTARRQATGFRTGNKGYIGTGFDGTFLKNDFWEYDPSLNVWTQKANFGGTARYGATGFAIGNKGYLGTGYGPAPIHNNDFWEYNPLCGFNAIITPGGPTAFCSGGNVTLNANTDTGFTYQWKLNGSTISGATNSSYVASAAGSYTVVVTNSSSCSVTSAVTGVTVISYPSASITVSPPGATTIPPNYHVTLTANSGTGYSYQWKLNSTNITGAISVSYQATQAGSYTVTVTNSSGCSTISSAASFTICPYTNIQAWGTNGQFPFTFPIFGLGGNSNWNTNQCSGLSTPGGEAILQLALPCYGLYEMSVDHHYNNTVSNYTLQVPYSGDKCNASNYSCFGYGSATDPYPYVDMYIISHSNGIFLYDSDDSIAQPFYTSIAPVRPDLSVSEIKTTSVKIHDGWQINQQTNYIEYGPPGFIPALFDDTTYNGTLVSSVAFPDYTLNGLQPSTTYDLYARSECNGAFSYNSNKITFTTPCVNAHVLSTSANNFCAGGSAMLTASGVVLNPGDTIKWYTGSCGGTFIGSGNSITVSPAVSTAYYAKVVSGCGLSYCGSITIIVRQYPNAVITAGGPVTFCSGGSVQLSSTTGASYTYQWLKNNATISGATNSTYVATATASYSVIITNYSVCSATSTPVSVTVNSLPSATITTGGPTIFCSGGSVVLSAPVTANRSYQWKKNGTNISGATLSSYTATSAGNYKVTVTNTQTGCSKTTAVATVITVNALPAATITPQGPTTFCAGGNVVLAATTGAGLTYKWKKGSSFISGATLSNYTAATGGNYKVQVTNSNGCSKTSGNVAVSVPCKEGESVKGRKGESVFEVKVYPNPTSGEFIIKFSTKPTSPVQIEITNEIGKIVKRFETDDETVLIKEPNLAKGIYCLTIRNKDEVAIKKINILK